MNDLRKAAEMALQYFEDAHGLEDTEVAIKEALRKALAEEALDRMAAENQRLGLYNDLQTAIERGTKAWADVPAGWVDELRGYDTPEETPEVDKAYTKNDTTDRVLHKEWVGLTDEEIQAERHKLDPTAGWTYNNFARAIEAKLKEKNT